MSYYRTCPFCGAHLDPGEVCDCQEENAAVGTRNTSGGGVEQVERTDSASYHTLNRRENQGGKYEHGTSGGSA